MSPATWAIAILAAAETAAGGEGVRPLTAAGWTIMIVSVGSVCVLTAYCFYKVMTLPPRDVIEHLKAPLDIDTKDTQHPD